MSNESNMSRAENVKLLDEVLGFRIVGQVSTRDMIRDMSGVASPAARTLGGAQVELLTKDAENIWRIRAVQPASGRELVLYNLLQEAWSDGRDAASDIPRIGFNPKGEVYMDIAMDSGSMVVYLRWLARMAEEVARQLMEAAKGARKMQADADKQKKQDSDNA